MKKKKSGDKPKLDKKSDQEPPDDYFLTLEKQRGLDAKIHFMDLSSPLNQVQKGLH